ncbi:MAG: hypothetical protein ACKVU4_08405 [Phycisphaerales bacterium]
MSALTRFSGWFAPEVAWPPGVVQLLDENHLVASSDVPRHRASFASTLERFLLGLGHAEVMTLQGRYIGDLESFCSQLERLFPGERPERRIDGSRGVTALLRSRDGARGLTPIKHRFYLWHDADFLLRADPVLFGRLVDALAGVAAEAEYASDDRLLLHRVAFVGGPLLDSYARYEDGQFRCWFDDEMGDPFWRVVTGLERPPVRRVSIDALAC